jgi:molecular chaperone HtpG
MSPHMRRLMKAMKVEGADDTPPRIELHFNPRHAVIKHLVAARDAKPEVAKLMAEQVLDNALIAAGLLDDPQKMIARIYKLLETIG